MGAIKVHEFTTVDGVVDAPMWTRDYGFPDDLSSTIGALTGYASGILLGRTTFEMFAPAWSTRTVEEDPGAPFFNETTKYVVSSTLTDASWENSSVVNGDVKAALTELKRETRLGTTGSATLVRWMLEQGLVDELHLLVHPVVVGQGKKLFADGAKVPLRLVSSTTFTTGVLHLVYAPAAS